MSDKPGQIMEPGTYLSAIDQKLLESERRLFEKSVSEIAMSSDIHNRGPIPLRSVPKFDEPLRLDIDPGAIDSLEAELELGEVSSGWHAIKRLVLSQHPDENFRPEEYAERIGRPELLPWLTTADNITEADLIIRRIDDENRWMQISQQNDHFFSTATGAIFGNPVTSFAPVAPAAVHFLRWGVKPAILPSALRIFAYNGSLAMAEASFRSATLEVPDIKGLEENMWMIAAAGTGLGYIVAATRYAKTGNIAFDSVATGGGRADRGPFDPGDAAEAMSRNAEGPTTSAERSAAGHKNIVDEIHLRETEAGSSVGAREVRPGKTPRGTDTRAEETLVRTGTGIEHLPLNPKLRLAGSPDEGFRMASQRLVNQSGMIFEKNKAGIRTPESVEDLYYVTYSDGLVSAERGLYDDYIEYMGKAATDSDTMRKIRINSPAEAGNVTFDEFVRRVSFALRRGDKSHIDDAIAPMVEKAAARYRSHFDHMARQAKDVGMFELRYEQQLERAVKKFNTESKKLDANPDRIRDLDARVKALKARIQKMKENGPFLNNGQSWLKRIYRKDLIEANPQAFEAKIRKGAMTFMNLSPTEASKMARSVRAQIMKEEHTLPLDQIDDALFGPRGSANVRTLDDFPDEFLEEWLESDIILISRQHTRSFGVDIELTRAFGDPSMTDYLDELAENYRGSPSRLQRDLRDLTAMRDMLRGTYGIHGDPNSIIAKAGQFLKSANVLAFMQGGAISSFPDVARVAMTEGFDKAFHGELRYLAEGLRSDVRKMNRAELQAFGEAADVIMGLYAQKASDMADPFMTRGRYARGANQLAGASFTLNGMNQWNGGMKELASAVITPRMIEDITKWAKTGKLDQERITRLAANNIDLPMAERIARQLDKYKEEVNGFVMPNTAKWDDEYAMLVFRSSVRSQVNRTVVTPGVGDKALWTEGQIGSILAQFKGFGQAAITKVLVSGLQENQRIFLHGALFLVGMGILVNEIKARMYGIDTSEDSVFDTILGGVDRSGLLGSFGDAWNATMTMTNGGFGAFPGQESTPHQKVGAALGPSGSMGSSVATIFSAAAGMTDTAEGLKAARSITPFQNHPVAMFPIRGLYNSAIEDAE